MTADGTEQFERVYPIEFSEGDEVGNCPDCGAVVGENVLMEFPSVAYCGLCGRELQKVTIAQHDGRITEAGEYARS